MKRPFHIQIQFDKEAEKIETVISKFLINTSYQTNKEVENAKSKISSRYLH